MEELCLETPLLIEGDPLSLNPLTVAMPLERVALSKVMEDGPASGMELMDVDEVDSLSGRGMYILSVCVWSVEVEGLMDWLSIRCLL